MYDSPGGRAIKNQQIGALLKRIGDLLEIKGESIYRVAAYREAARQIEHWPEDISQVAREGRLREIPGVGESISAKIEEYLKTGHIQYYEDLQRQINPEVVDLLQVPGLGPRKAQEINQKLGIHSVAELQAAAKAHKLSGLPGIGDKTEEKLLKEARRVQARSRRLLLDVALHAAEDIVALLRDHPAVQDIEPAGSIRRRQETIGDIDLLVSSKKPDAVMDAFTTLPLVREVLSKGSTRGSILNQDNLQIDLRVMDPSTYGAALQYFTGSKAHNIALRTFALSKGMSISEYGIFDTATNKRLGGERESEIYERLGMQFIPPELREDRGELEAALDGRIPKLIDLTAIKGDLHVHTDWTDGISPITDMIDAAIELGYDYIAITDHSRSLGIARGLPIERLRQQQALIKMLNQKYTPFTILCGTEVDILKDGSIDFPNEVLETLDIVTASIHSGFSQSRETMTKRIITALENPYVDVLNHPTGRLLEKRPGFAVDLERVLRAAVRTGTVLEINASPDRLDLDDIWARRAKEMGIKLVISTDSHSTSQLDQMRFGVFVARRGWLEARNVINTGKVERLRHKHQRKSA
jgi:DNA polymerase (family 10)